MSDFGPPIQLKAGPGGVKKVKRGGTGKISNSGNERGRFHTPIRQHRSTKDGKQLPWPVRGRAIWNPLDPVIAEYRRTHPRVEAAWRSQRGSVIFDIETRHDS